MDLSDLIDRNAAFAPAKPAIRFAGTTLTYADLAQRIEASARGLKAGLGIARGDRVAVLALNHPDTLVLLYACARLGATLVPLNWRLAPAEQAFIMRDAGVKALVLQEAFAGVLAPLAREHPGTHLVGLDHVPAGGMTFDALLRGARGDGRSAGVATRDPLLIVYTSGTTGRPKGAVLTQEALIANAAMSQHCHDMTSADHVLTVLPMFHVGGLNIQTTPALQAGATVTIHERFAAGETLHAIAHDRPTLLLMVPSTMQAMIEHPLWSATRFSSLRAVSTGSTQVPQGLIDPFVARGLPVLQVYGATETAPVAIYTRLAGDWRRPGSTGLPGLMCDARVIDDAGREVPHGTAGEVEVKGPNVLVEYWGNPAATAEALVDGWFRTGDIGTRDADGYFTIHDRKKNMIISGGENIYPAEVERVLLSHPLIAEAAVIGQTDPRWQEVPVGCIVLRPGAQLSSMAIEAYCLAELARYKVPRQYVFLDALPRNVMGKVQHFALRERVGAHPLFP
jgi:fatty-acyl-CoA synthase